MSKNESWGNGTAKTRQAENPAKIFLEQNRKKNKLPSWKESQVILHSREGPGSHQSTGTPGKLRLSEGTKKEKEKQRKSKRILSCLKKKS